MMKPKYLYLLLAVLSVIIGIVALINEHDQIERLTQISFLFFLLGYHSKRLRSPGKNFYGFFVALVVANICVVFEEIWYFSYLSVVFCLICFGFIMREAIRFTQYNRGSWYMQLFFLFVVGFFIYFVSLQLLEVAGDMGNSFSVFMYLVYYFSLLILGITALVYYLNSFSRKSLYFTCFVLALIFSDILRDLGVFYLKDISVEIAGVLMQFAALKFAFLFFVKKEKKLRLLHMV